MSFFSNINASPIDRLKNKIEHVIYEGVINVQKNDDSLAITYTVGRTYNEDCVEIPYNWLINKIFSIGLDINNIDKIEYRSLFTFGKKNNQLIKDLHLTFYEKDKIVKTMLLSQYLDD